MKSNVIRELRLKNKLKVKDIVHLLGISRGHYNHLENGTRGFTDDLLNKASVILKVSPGEIKRMSSELQKRNAPPNSWMFKIQIDGKPLVKAFQEYYSSMQKDGNIEDMVTKFITYRIEHSVREELRSNSDISNFILARVNS